MSVSYAIWSAVALIAVIGVGRFKEPVTALKLVSMGFIIAGVAGLNAGVRGP
jgi:small multidrug resistance pump